MQTLKEQAKQHLQEILQQAAAGSRSSSSTRSSRSYGSSVDTRQLRSKLEAAIRVMQTGLVERDTEVRGGGRGERLGEGGWGGGGGDGRQRRRGRWEAGADC